jgi:ABC-type transporter Mla subunit MlaD
MQKEKEIEIYSDYLTLALKKAKMNSGQINAIIEQFNGLVAKGKGAAESFTALHETYASTTDTDVALASIKDIIKSALEDVNKTVTVDSNPRSRLKKLIENLNANIQKCGFTIDGKDALSQTEIDRIKQRVPSCLRSSTKFEKFEQFSATAAVERKSASLSLECWY